MNEMIANGWKPIWFSSSIVQLTLYAKYQHMTQIMNQNKDFLTQCLCWLENFLGHHDMQFSEQDQISDPKKVYLPYILLLFY